MFKKILICAVSAVGLTPAAALADSGAPPHRHATPAHYAWRPARDHGWRAPGSRSAIRPRIIKGYYTAGFARHAHAAYRGIDPYPPPGPRPLAYPPDADAGYDQPVLAYSSATAYIPVTTYAPLPVRVYYIPQREPYYNVPPYVVLAPPCVCD